MIQATKKLTVMNLLSDFTDGISNSPIPSIRMPVLSGTNLCLISANIVHFFLESFQFGSPETPDYFRMAMQTKHASRWKEDWEELELLGRGAFGSVVKARNKIDSRTYAGKYDVSASNVAVHTPSVKKIRLKSTQSDKIFREVNALSRLSHRNIVRYYTTWVETAEPDVQVTSSDDSSAEYDTEERDFKTSVPPGTPIKANHQPINGGFHVNIEDFDDLSLSGMSFPSIHFGISNSAGGSEGSGEDSTSSEEQDGFAGLFKSGKSISGSKSIRAVSPTPTAPVMTRTLYIQMVSLYAFENRLVTHHLIGIC